MKNLLDIYARKKKDVAAIERELEECIYSEHAMLRETSLHLLKAGGKRIRPVFVLLSGEFGTYQLETMKHIAVPLELIHMATLVHDDVIDDANTRRGQLTVRSKWDNRIAMYTGDYILGKALGVITRIPNPTVHQIMSKAMVEVCIGEMEQIRSFFHAEQTIRDYLLRVKRKTALLIAISCQLGAIAAEAPDWICSKLYDFGYNVGMAYQIRDDILDLTGTEKQLGKPPGSDIKQGNITIPVLFAIGENPEIKSAVLEELARIEQLDGQTDVSRFLELIRSSHGVSKAEQLSQKYIDKAIHALDQLPDIRAKRDLTEVAHFIGNRSY
jgi:heptaprenyl diphosphate synthase